MKLQTVHLRVNDAATQKPTPCRIRITDGSGQEYAPFGRTLNFSTNRGEDVGGHVKLGRERWFTIDGACEIAVPPGELRVQVRKGLEFPPIDETSFHPAGKMSIRLSLQRHKIVIKPEWWTIDMRCHGLTPHAALLDGAAEDLDVINLLAEPVQTLGNDGNPYRCVPNLLAFSGQSPCLFGNGSRVIVNTHHRHGILGSLGLLHCHRVIHPLDFGGADATDDWSLEDWAGQCHRKGGLVVWTEPFAPNKPFAGEALALAITGKVDAFELSPDFLSGSLRGWYQLLNAGVRLPLVGASGRSSNQRSQGALQTVAIGDDGEWVQSIKDGFTKVTNGPVPGVSVVDQRVYASAQSLTKFDRLELIANGAVIARAESRNVVQDLWIATLDCEIMEPAWVAARVVDSATSPLDAVTPLFGHTSAQWIGEPRRDPAAVAFLNGHLDRLRDWIENVGRFENPNSKQHLLDTVAAASAKLT